MTRHERRLIKREAKALAAELLEAVANRLKLVNLTADRPNRPETDQVVREVIRELRGDNR